MAGETSNGKNGTNGDNWNKWWPRVHQVVLFFIGIVGILYAAFSDHADKPGLIYLFSTLIGVSVVMPPLKGRGGNGAKA